MLLDVLLGHGASEVSAMDVYSDVFRLGSHLIETSDEGASGATTHKANPIVLGSFDGMIRRRIMFEDTFERTLAEFQAADWAILNGLTYWGRANTGDAQSKACALVFDLDGQDDATLGAFLSGAGAGAYPTPQYVTLSGHNVHLYYLFGEALDLYPSVKTQLKDLKYHLTDLIWNTHTSRIEKPQHQGINQGFRVIGGRAKDGGVVRAFRLSDRPCTLAELNSYVPQDHRVDVGRVWPASKCSLDAARRRWPDWYERVVVGGAQAGHVAWPVKADLYEWWLRRCRAGSGGGGVVGDRYFTDTGVTVGHRYFCLMALAIFGAKCGITDRARVRADMESLVPSFNALDPSRPFGCDGEVDAAMECLDLRYVTFPRRDIERLTAVAMPPNKRNGRKLEQHMAYLNGLRKMRRDVLGEDEYADAGRPTKRDLVRAYAAAHPGENHSQVARALGVSRPTVIKWLRDS